MEIFDPFNDHFQPKKNKTFKLMLQTKTKRKTKERSWNRFDSKK
jgi:hypothetical protein